MELMKWMWDCERRQDRLHYESIFTKAKNSGACKTCSADCFDERFTWNCYLGFTQKAAELGHLECLHSLHRADCPWDDVCTMKAASSGHLECLKYLHENGCRWCISTTNQSAMSGKLECLKYAHKMGCQCDVRTAHCAAQSGHLHCLRYLHENGVHWDYDTLQGAARKGHVDCVKYAFLNGCILNRLTIYYAACEKQQVTLKWAMERNFPWDLTDETEDIIIKTWVEIRFSKAIAQYAVDIIEQYWVRSLHDPKYLLCKRRLLKEFQEMTQHDFSEPRLSKTIRSFCNIRLLLRFAIAKITHRSPTIHINDIV